MQTLFNRLYAKFLKWTEGDLGIQIRKGVPVERFGTHYGGCIVPKGHLDAKSVCYLIGAGEDISFDMDIASTFGCPVHIFDPTPRAVAHVEKVKKNLVAGETTACATEPAGFYKKYPAATASLLHMHPYGIWHEDTTLRFYKPLEQAHVSHSIVNLQKSTEYIEVPVRRLSGIMRELGHQRIDLLKIDTEGAEYQIIDSIVDDRIEVNMICLAFDESASNHIDLDYGKRIKAAMDKLTNTGFYVIAKEPDSRNYTLIHQRLLGEAV